MGESEGGRPSVGRRLGGSDLVTPVYGLAPVAGGVRLIPELDPVARLGVSQRGHYSGDRWDLTNSLGSWAGPAAASIKRTGSSL